MSRLLSTLLHFRHGYSWKASNSISSQNKLGDLAAGVFALVIIATLLADGFSEYVNQKVDERTAEQRQQVIDAQAKQDHAERVVIACMNGGSIKTGEWTAIFCDPSKEMKL